MQEKYIQYINQEDSISMKSLRTRKQQEVGKASKEPKKEPKKQITKKKSVQPLSREQIRKRIMMRFDKMRELYKGQKKIIPSLLLADCLQEEELCCGICLQLMANPTTLPCGHTFCIRCIHSLNKTEQKYKCALCRATDFSNFYEIDPFVEKLLKLILKRVGQCEWKEYESRKGALLKELPVRGSTLQLKTLNEVQVRVGDVWQLGTIVNILEVKKRRFYWVRMLMSEQRYLLPVNSVNLAPSQIHHQFNPYIRINSPCLMPAIFRQVRMPPPINQGFNIEELLWEVNYYPPAQADENRWFQQASVPEMQLEFEDSDSVMFLGRNPAPNQYEIIEID